VNQIWNFFHSSLHELICKKTDYCTSFVQAYQKLLYIFKHFMSINFLYFFGGTAPSKMKQFFHPNLKKSLAL